MGYLEDGPDLVGMAMNGWDEGHPSWWLNLEDNPDCVVRLAGEEPRSMHAREATGDERDRLWQRWAEVDKDLDAYAARRLVRTPIVVFEQRSGQTPIDHEPIDQEPMGDSGRGGRR